MRVRHSLRRLREEPRPVRFAASRALWRSGLCRALTVRTPHGFQMRFWPSSVSAALWVDPAFRAEDVRFVRAVLLPGDTYVDVGANVGQLTLAGAQRVGPRGRVVAVEPQAHLASFLRGNVRLNGLANVEVVEAAVADQAGEASLARAASDDQAYLRPGAGIRVATLDQVLASAGPIALLKVDVEGCESRVLRGASRILARTLAIHLEYSEANLARFGDEGPALLRLLSSAGFEVFDLRSTTLVRFAGQPRDATNVVAVAVGRLPEFLARTGFQPPAPRKVAS